MTSRLPITRPVKRPTDLSVDVFEDIDVALYDLVMASLQRGDFILRNKTFRGCRLQGPGVLLASETTLFNDTNFGDPRGDIRNLVLRPAGEKIVGAYVMHDCVFDGCEFYAVAFTGGEPFLQSIIDLENPQVGAPA